eukprot:2756567-Prymnesium_polylepis.1
MHARVLAPPHAQASLPVPAGRALRARTSAASQHSRASPRCAATTRSQKPNAVAAPREEQART